MDTINRARSVDFYVGRGEGAEYLGSEWGREPYALPSWLEFCSLDNQEYTEQDYRSTVKTRRRAKNILSGVDFASAEWPHRHATSDSTAWTLCYDKGSIYVYHYGVEMQVWRCNTHATTRRRGQVRRESRPVNHFPPMPTPVR